MTTKEQELWRDIANSLYIGFTTTESCNNRADELLSKARECYSEELQAERMVTFKLSQQIEKKDAALRSALEWLDEDEAPQLQRQIKEALK